MRRLFLLATSILLFPFFASAASPFGGLDLVSNCDSIIGWAQDPDFPSQPITVAFYVDAPSGASAYVGQTIANQIQGRQDLVSIGAQNSSYAFSVPNQYRDGKQHTVFAYGLDTTYAVGSSDSTQFTLLTGSPKSFTCAPRTSQLKVSSNDGAVAIEPVGNIETVFNAGTDRCTPDDVPDTAQHAFRRADGSVVLTGNAQGSNFRSVGATLDTVKRVCAPAYSSANDPIFGNFKYREWLFSPYTLDGTTVYALSHNEWYPSVATPPFCPVNTGPAPVVGAITLLLSHDGGATYSHPANYKVAVPTVPWSGSFSCSNTAYGDWNVSNIVAKDGYYYALFNRVADPLGVASSGTCAMRTTNLSDASSWVVWTGTEWKSLSASVRCQPLSGLESWVWTVVESVSYSTYLQKYVALAIDNSTQVSYSLSDDLIHWSAPQKILSPPVSEGNLMYGSLLDPTDTSRNFENIGREPYLYFSLDGNIIRQKIRFTMAVSSSPPPAPSVTPSPVSPPAPSATLAPSPVSAPTYTQSDPVAALKAQVAALLAQIAQLRGNSQSATSSQAASACPVIKRLLVRGSRGADVMALQTFLVSQKLLASDSATGYFGGLTQAALQQWQSSRGIVSSGSPSATGWGTVGLKTRAALASCGL